MTDLPMPRLYFDNAATSFPKPPAVQGAMVHYATHLGASPGRGAYAETIEAGRRMNRCRDLICRLIHGESADHVIFTLNCTDALNLALRGVASHYRQMNRPIHVVTTELEHNSILRPLNALKDEGVEHTRVPCDPVTGLVDIDDLRNAIQPHTRMVAMLHGSNVSGTLQPIREVGSITREREILLLVDAAQTLGHYPTDVQDLNIDLLAFPGHKGLLGPLGTGGLYIRPGVDHQIHTIREGGTGSVSEQDVQPDFMPDKFESGSHNALGIIGLAEGVQWILDQGVEQLWQNEQTLSQMMLNGLLGIPGLRLLGPQALEDRCGVFSIVTDGWSPAELAGILEEHYGILSRPGLHCAPLAHQIFGTMKSGGATRLSLGPFLHEDDARHVIEAVHEVCKTGVEVNS